MLSEDELLIALSGFTLPFLQVAEAATALGDGCTAESVSELVGAEAGPVLDALVETGVLRPAPDHGFGVQHLRAVWPEPLGLGPTLRELLKVVPTVVVRSIATTLGLKATAGKPGVIGLLSDAEAVRALADDAPGPLREQLHDLAWRRYDPEDWFTIPRRGLDWAIARGLVVDPGWSRPSRMPAEVAIALRGKQWRAPFDPQPPVVTAVPVTEAEVRREAAAAATALLAAATAAGGALAGQGIATLKDGTVGVRELRKLAKTTGHDERRLGLILDLFDETGLAEAKAGRLVRSRAFVKFARLEPPEQLVNLLGVLLTGAGPLSAAALETLVALDGGIGESDLTAQVRWRHPLLALVAGDELGAALAQFWEDSHLTGVLAHGMLTPLGRVMLEPGDPLGEASRLVAAAVGTALFQADLSVVAGGNPTADLLALLDGAAVPESRSGAWTWRFTPASVRAALDAGTSAATLRKQLTKVAEHGTLPQPLTYLLDDVARRHGHITVHAAGCCLTAEDDTLLAEILATKSLRPLGLRRLAPAVLAATAGPDETLQALRAAGYLPVGDKIGRSHPSNAG